MSLFIQRPITYYALVFGIFLDAKKLEICFLNIKFIALYTYSRDIRAENLTSKYVIGLKSCNVEAPYSTQWGSEIRTSLDLEWSKEVGLQIVRISNGIRKPNHLISGQMAAILSQTT